MTTKESNLVNLLRFLGDFNFFTCLILVIFTLVTHVLNLLSVSYMMI